MINKIIFFFLGILFTFSLPYLNYDFRVWYSRHLLDCVVRIAPDVEDWHVKEGRSTGSHKNGVCVL